MWKGLFYTNVRFNTPMPVDGRKTRSPCFFTELKPDCLSGCCNHSCVKPKCGQVLDHCSNMDLDPLMGFQVTLCWEALVTLCAFKWNLSWVDGCSSNLMLSSSCYNLCTWMASLLSGSSHVLSSNLIMGSSCHTLCTWMASLPCGSSHHHRRETV